MHVCDALQKLPENVFRLHLGQAAALHDPIEKLTSPHKLHNQENGHLCPVNEVEPDDLGVSQLAQNLNLAVKLLHVGFKVAKESEPLQIDDLGGELFTGG
mmetsp:Transcript_64288/g.126475  ORF Transcript_64288/g.126475 Transcript_64288/m.126475 type:complete len:100 (-) Transcript_64288:188-487(-)